MCGTLRSSASAQTCSFCGYIYEDNLTSSQIPVSQELSGSNRTQEGTVETTTSAGFSFNQKESALKTQDNIIYKNGRTIQEGALLLTNRRLVFAAGESLQEDADVQKVLQDGDVFSIPLDQIANVTGNRGFLRPSLKVIWHSAPGDSNTTKTEFLQKNAPRSIEDAKNSINEWGSLIEHAAVSDVEAPEFQVASPVVSKIDDAELRSRVLEELGDMKWKGFFQMERDIEEKYGNSVDPDSLENCCSNLVKEKLVEQDKHGEFFKKIAPNQK